MTKIKHTTYLLFTGILLISLLGNQSFAQQEKSDKVSEFEIFVTQTNSGIDLVCSEGCAWKKLSFNTPNKYKPQAINQLGMADIKDTYESRRDQQTFLFTMQKTNEGLSLKGLKGTAWESLAFSIKNGKQGKLTALGVEL